MSSLDSTLNSLSATTVRDIVDRFISEEDQRTDRQNLLLSKGLTVFWGAACITFAFFVGDISDSIIVSINKIGSLANGSILATFLLAILTRRATDKGVVIGIIAGFLINLYLWLYQPGVSWLWWNLIGCAVAFGVGYGASLFFDAIPADRIVGLTWSRSGDGQPFAYRLNWNRYYLVLALYFVAMIAVLALI